MKSTGTKILLMLCSLLLSLTSAFGGSAVLTAPTYMRYGPGTFDTVKMGGGPTIETGLQTVTIDDSTGWVVSGRLDSASFPYHELNYGPGRSTRFLANSLISFSGGYVSDGYMNNPGTSVQLYYGNGLTTNFSPLAHVKFSGGYVSDCYLADSSYSTSVPLSYGNGRTANFSVRSHIKFSGGYVSVGYLDYNSSAQTLYFGNNRTAYFERDTQVMFAGGYVSRGCLSANNSSLAYGSSNSAYFLGNSIVTFLGGYVASGTPAANNVYFNYGYTFTDMVHVKVLPTTTITTDFVIGLLKNVYSEEEKLLEKFGTKAFPTNSKPFQYAVGWNYLNDPQIAEINAAIKKVHDAYDAVLGGTMTYTVGTIYPLVTFTPGVDSRGYLAGATLADSAWLRTPNGTVSVAAGTACVFSGGYYTDGGPYAPVFISQPTSQTVTAGNGVTFSATAVGSPNALTYQWKKNGVNIPGATNATYTIASSATSDAGLYTVSVTNSVGSTSSSIATLTVNSSTGGSPGTVIGGATTSASFNGTDTSTQGNWRGVYGSDGYDIVGLASSLPAYATVSYANASEYTWMNPAPSTTSQALQKPGAATDRIAACKYSGGSIGSSFTIDVTVSGGTAKPVSLYLLDFDATNTRAETVQVQDGNTGAILDTQYNVGAFSSGKWLKYTVKGRVKFVITHTGNVNAVYSGIFFGNAGGAIAANSATYNGTDTSTQGNWRGVYGADGYDIVGLGSSLPAYATVSYVNSSEYTWMNPAPGTSVQALQKPGSTTDRIAACKYTSESTGNYFIIDVTVSGGTPKAVSLYLLDWDATNTRAETVQVQDGDTGAILDTQYNAGVFSSGKWLKYTVNGHVKFVITHTGNVNAVYSGILFQ